MRRKTACEYGCLERVRNERFLLHGKILSIFFWTPSAIICEGLIGLLTMSPIHATVLSAERFRDQYRLIIQLVPSEFLGPFERLRFKKNPYCGSFGTSVDKSWLTLDYRKDPGFKAGEAFPLWRTN
jgi:hypothetical protein